MSQALSFVFFGTPRFAEIVLETLKKDGLTPSLIVTTPDKPVGRGLVLTAPPTKIWAQKNNIPVLQPEKLDSTFVQNLRAKTYNLFVVASYGKIIPPEVFTIPKFGTLNIHPSLLPKLRGASPIETAILEESETGVTIINIDEEMDHGPILAQKKTSSWQENNPPYFEDLEEELAVQGAKLLAETIPGLVRGEVKEKEQDHSGATYTKKVQKEDALIKLEGSSELNLRKILAYHEWPRAYTFFSHAGKQIRVIITRARIENRELIIEKVIPEGRKEIAFEEFRRGYLN